MTNLTVNKIKMINIPSLKTKMFQHRSFHKRALFLSSEKVKASMALEGSIVIPLFLFFMMTLLLSIEAVRFQSDVQESLHQSGNRSAFVGFQVKYEGEEKNNVEKQINEFLENQMYPYLCVDKENEGIFVQDLSSIEENGQIEITVTYQLRPFIRILPIGEIRIQDRFFGHAWTGYCEDNENKNQVQEAYVYITKTGTKYHMQHNCTYLRVQIQAVNYSQISSLRNSSGGKYYACQRCKSSKEGLIYITSEGSSYHGQSDCSALKRTVYMIPLSEAEGYSACSKCAG